MVLKRWNTSILYRAIRSLAGLLRAWSHARTRSEAVTRWREGKLHLQGPTFTKSDRFPVLFQYCKSYLQTNPAPRLLSFGCSTGEEVFSLAKYLPNAEIVGVDVNLWCLRQCKCNNTNGSLRFMHRSSREYKLSGDFDAIFCLAVLQRAENRQLGKTFVDGGFTFAAFERELSELHLKLKPGGLLFLDHCDYRLNDTAIATHYKPVVSGESTRLRERPVFDGSNRLIANSYIATRIYVKVHPSEL